MTYRERREARAERLRGWAAKRYAGAEAVSKMADQYRGDVAFYTQPGHIPERERLNCAQERSWQSIQKANSMNDHATTIEQQLERSIYSDDPDAIERLRERIAALEAERDLIKRYNASCRRNTPTDELLSAQQLADLATIRRVGMGRPDGSFPSYVLTNLSSNIARQRERLARLEASR